MNTLKSSKISSVNLKTYLDFLNHLENLSDNPDDYANMIHAEVEFRELPNLLNKNGQIRNLEMSLEGVKKAKMILAGQKYEIVGVIEDGDKITVEKIWTGKMSMDIGSLKKDQELKAYICAVVEFKDGKIYRHRFMIVTSRFEENMIDEAWAKEFANEWIEAWNSHDLERVFSHYADDFEMSSPFIVQRMKVPAGTLKGKENIRPYWQIGLEQVPPLRFELSDILVGANSITILYRNQKNISVAEVLFFKADGKATSGFAHYAEKSEL